MTQLLQQLFTPTQRCFPAAAVSAKKNLLEVVGGTQAFLRPNLAEEVNADFVATNASHALTQALSLLVKTT
jgi:hypothetical protein